jgi:D-3-phosphoglycerate dehydrogenase
VAEPVVALLEPLADSTIRDELSRIVAPCSLVSYDEVPSGPGIVALIVGPDSPVSEIHLKQLPDVQVVAISSTGFDHVDVTAAAEGGVWVTNVVGYSTDEVADHALALVLDLLRGVSRADRSVHEGHWAEALGGRRRISGTRLGLFGFGRIAQALALRTVPLGMATAAYAPRAADSNFHRLGVQRLASLPELLEWADVLSLHVPLNADTRGVIDRKALSRLKPGSFVVNVSRGGLIDQVALIDAVTRGHVAGAALDVLDSEPVGADDPILATPGIVLTPHVAWESPDTLRRVLVAAASEVASVLAGGEPNSVVGRPEMPAMKGTA